MAEERLSIIIDAQTKDSLKGFGDIIKGLDGAENATLSFNKSLETLQNELKSLKKSLTSATDINTIAKLNADIQRVTESIRKQSDATAILANATRKQADAATIVSNSQNSFTNSLQKSGEVAAKSKVNYTDLGRVLQDLPYGFNAIANNLTQLIPSAGALGLAFTAVVTAVTFATNGFTAWTGSTKNAKKELEDLNKYTEDFAKNLAEEKTQLDILFATTTNANIPLEQRKNAIKELRNNYGNYLKNFSDEEILLGKATSAYNLLTDAIIRSARARAAQDQIIKLQEDSIKLEIKLADIAKKAQQDASKATGTGKSLGEAIGANLALAGANALSAEQQRALIFEKASKNAKVVADQIGGINEQIKTYSDLVQQNQAAPFKLDKAEKILKQKQPKIEKPEPLQIEKVKDKNFRLDINKRQAPIIERPEKLIKPVEPPKPATLAGALDAKTQELLKQLDLQNQISAQQQQNAEKEQKDILALAAAYGNLLFPAIDGVFAALQNGTSITEALGESFKKLAIDLAATAAKAAILAGIMSIISPASLTKAGGFGGIFKSLLGFANGGIVNKPTIGVVGERNQSEAIMPLSKLSGMLNMAANIGASNMGASGEFVIRGNDLVLATTRANNALNLRRG